MRNHSHAMNEEDMGPTSSLLAKGARVMTKTDNSCTKDKAETDALTPQDSLLYTRRTTRPTW